MTLQTNLMIIAVLAGGQLWAAGGKVQDCGPVLKLKVIDGRPVVDCVFVNGHGPYRFLVDTGTQTNMLDPGSARSAGLKTTFQADMITPLGSVKVPGGDGIEVTLGEAKAGDQRFVFSGMEDIQRFAPEIQGVLGQAFLSHFDYLLDLQAKRLEFGKMELPGTRTPLRITQGLPAVSTSLGPLLLDSGAGQVVFFGVETRGATRKVSNLTGSTEVGLVTGKPMTIEGRSIRYGQAVTVAQTENVDAVGVIPARLFKTVYVCGLVP